MAHNPFEEINTRLDKLEEILKSFAAILEPQKPHADKLGGIDFAIQITGLKRSTIYVKVSRNEIPHFKRGGKLYFSGEALKNWITTPAIEPNQHQLHKPLFPKFKK